MIAQKLYIKANRWNFATSGSRNCKNSLNRCRAPGIYNVALFRTRNAGLFFFLTITTARAQQSTGEIHLEVRDPAGSVMAASGRLQNLASGSFTPFDTDPRGAYTFKDLAFGRYRLQVSKSGFAAQSVLIDVLSAAPVSRTITLALAPQTSKIDVVAATPLPGTDLPIDLIPAPVQTASARDIEQSGSLDLSDLLNKRLNGVHINENQENPFQPDVNYRGYTASPLLGTPEGISVYMDGVRQNRAFPAISSTGSKDSQNRHRRRCSNARLQSHFGLNTLGGTISVQTKDGNSAPGVTLSINGGSFGRRAGEVEYGSSSTETGLDWYLAGNLFREDGWRQD